MQLQIDENSHAILHRRFRSVAILPPVKSWVVTIFFFHFELMEHSFQVAHECYEFLSESTEDANKGICYVWTLKELLVEWMASESCTAIKDNSDLAGVAASRK